MKNIIILFIVFALLVSGCGGSSNKSDYRIVNNGETTILSGQKYGLCSAGMKMTKLEVVCIKDGRKTLVILADSFELIVQEPTK